MNGHSLTWSWTDRLTAILVSIAVICVCLMTGNCGALAEAQSPEATVEPTPLESALPYLQQNSRTVGWLKVGNIVDTPVVRGEGSFYLNHNFLREHATGGTVFLDEHCSIWPKDEHMVLYGHNMRNGTVFGNLDYYRELSYLKRYPIITFDTIYEEAKYVVVSVYDMSGETEDPHFMQMLQFNFADNEDFWTFFHQTERRDRNIYDIPVDVQYGDKLLTLITCSYTLYDGRLIVMCRELRPDETEEEVTALMQSTTMKR